METSIREVSPMVRVLDIAATAADLETDLRVEVRKQRASIVMNGFRPGHVPAGIIKRLHGKALAATVLENLVKEVFDDLVVQPGEYQLMGEPKVLSSDYKVDGDLKASIQFIVMPEIEFKDLSDELIEVPVADVRDELVDEFLDRRRVQDSKPRPFTEDERIGEDEEFGHLDIVTGDQRVVDPKTRLPIVGEEVGEFTFSLDEKDLVGDPEYEAIRKALSGKRIGDEVFVVVAPNPSDSLVDQIPKKTAFLIKIEGAERIIMPDMDEEWCRTVSFNEVSTEAELRVYLKEKLEEAAKERNLASRDDEIRARMRKLYDFEIPQSVYGPGAMEQMRAGMDAAEALKYAREDEHWNVIAVALANHLKIEVTDQEALDKAIEYNGEQAAKLMMKSKGMPELMARRVMMDKIMEHLIDQFDIVERALPEGEALTFITSEMAW